MTTRFTPTRLDSIDIFRALTMFLMIFVNDLWTLEGVPGWLEHSAAKEDAMGFSDVIFPCFLFIVGLSIPFAIANRRVKGDTALTIVWHILERTFALLLMGIFTVNLENAHNEMLISKYLWEILMVIGFFLIWNVYPDKPENKSHYRLLKFFGYLVLIGLAVIYKGGEGDNVIWMKTHWYGILGLIGWSYLLCALVYLAAGDRLIPIIAAWLFFTLFNLADFAGILAFMDGLKAHVWIVGSGSMPAFTMGGIVASVIYRKYSKTLKPATFLLILLMLGILSFAYGFGTRPFWGISKIRATPAWVGICSGISFAAFAFFYWLTDLHGKKGWASILKPAGTSTLTCYLIPYVWYAVVTLAGITLPIFLRTGLTGIVKSLLFALIIVLCTGLINKIGIKLKI
jgi:heparan-alpha-glucosaminide N-acetyltransferase